MIFFRGGLDADLIVVGSSQAWCGYDTYRRFNSKPKVILINTVFWSTLGISAHEQYEREQFFPYINDDTLISLVANDKKITWFDRHLPSYRYYGYREDIEDGIGSFFGKTQFQYGGMHKGFYGKVDKWNSGPILSKDTLINEPISQKAVNLLDSFTKTSCEEGIEVVFVKSPMYYPIRAKFANISQIDSLYESISEKYGIPILDYSFSSIAMDSGNFVNPSHLNKRGAELFTTKLCHDLDSIGITKR